MTKKFSSPPLKCTSPQTAIMSQMICPSARLRMELEEISPRLRTICSRKVKAAL